MENVYVEVRNSYRRKLEVWNGKSLQDVVNEHEEYLKDKSYNMAENEIDDEEILHYGSEEKAIDVSAVGILETFKGETTYKEIKCEDIRLETISWLEKNQTQGAFDDVPEANMDFSKLDEEDIEWYFNNWVIEDYEQYRY